MHSCLDRVIEVTEGILCISPTPWWPCRNWKPFGFYGRGRSAFHYAKCNTCREWLSQFRTNARMKRIKHDKPQWNDVTISSAKVYGIMLISFKPLNVFFITEVTSRIPGPSRFLVEGHRNRCRMSISKSVGQKNASGHATLNDLKVEWLPNKTDLWIVTRGEVLTNWTQWDQLPLYYFS